MDENLTFKTKNKNEVFFGQQDRMRLNFADMTRDKMVTYTQFQEQQFQEVNQGFLAMETNEFYMTNRVRENVLMIDEILDNANTLQLSVTQKEDLRIRRNRVKDFELLNHHTKDDSKEMRLLKAEIREYDQLLSQKPTSFEELQQFCGQIERKCDDAIKRCNDYLGKGKSKKFWKKNRNERFHLVEEAKARYVKEKGVIKTLSQLRDVNQYLQADDTMLDLMNIEKINDRLLAHEEAQRRQQEELNQQQQQNQQQNEQEQNQNEQEQNQNEQQNEHQNEQEQNQNEQEQNQQQNQQEQNQNQQDQNQGEQHQENVHQENKNAQAQEQQNQEQQQEQKKEEQQQQQLFRDQELKKLEAGNTPEIIAVRNAITSIQTEMAKQMPPVSVTGDMKADRKAERRVRKRSVDGKEGIDEFCAKMVKKFSILQNSIDDCLKKANGDGYGQNNALKDILEQLRDVTKKDRTLFRDKVLSYRASLAENANEAVKAHTWCDAWKYVRAVAYDLDDNNNGLETKITGAGASTITVITDTKKKETVYFRKDENAGGNDPKYFVEQFMSSIEGDIKVEKKVKDALEKLFKSLVSIDEMRNSEDAEALTKVLKIYRTGDNFEAKIIDFANTDHCTEIVKDLLKEDDTSKETKEQMGMALTFFARKFFQWDFSKNSAFIDPNHSLTDRNVATSRLAAALGISSMVSDSRTAVIKKDGKETMGNVMEDSRGQDIRTIQKDWRYSNKAIGQLFTLQVFDMICGQIDRHKGNVHGITKEKGGKLVVNSIRAIDNDMAFGTLNWGKFGDGYQNIPPLTECHLRAMPVEVVNKILALDKTALQELLGDLLDETCMDALVKRLGSLQIIIKNYSDPRPGGNGLKVENKVAQYMNKEDADDELRMLKAVEQFKQELEADDAVVKKWDGTDADVYVDEWKSLIDWDHLTLKDIQKRIEERRKQLQGNNQAGNNQEGNHQA